MEGLVSSFSNHKSRMFNRFKSFKRFKKCPKYNGLQGLVSLVSLVSNHKSVIIKKRSETINNKHCRCTVLLDWVDLRVRFVFSSLLITPSLHKWFDHITVN